MADFLVIRLGAGADDRVTWLAVDDRGTRRSHPGSGSLEEAAREVHERPVIVLVPAEEALTVVADVPAKGARLIAALPFALEDQLADDIENLHFAPGERLADGAIPVAVVAHSTLQGWLERLEAAGIAPAKIIPENHGLPRTPNTLSMLVADDQLMFNDGGRTEFAIAGVRPSEVLDAAGLAEATEDENEQEPARHLLVYCDPPSKERYAQDWALLSHELASVDIQLLPDGPLSRLATTVASGIGINLLQGRYGPRTEVGKMLKPWRFAALFLLAFFVVGFVAKGADYYHLSREQAALSEQFCAEYQRVRPGASCQIADPKAAVDSLERSIRSGAAGPQVFLPSIQTLANALRENREADVEAVSYRAGVVDVRLSAPDIPTLDKIVQSIDASGRFTASLQSATNVGDRVNSRIQIREGGA